MPPWDGGKEGEELASTWPLGGSSLRVDGRGLSRTLPPGRGADHEVRPGFRFSSTAPYINSTKMASIIIYSEGQKGHAIARFQIERGVTPRNAIADTPERTVAWRMLDKTKDSKFTVILLHTRRC